MRDKNQNTVLQEFKATQSEELLTFLLENKVRKSRSAIKSLLTHKQIKVNNSIVTQYNYLLTSGDKVTINKHDHKLDEKKLKGLTIVYEDKHLIVIDKDSGLLSVSTGKDMSKETAYNIVNNYLKTKNAQAKAYIMYRLDREMSGLMIFTKDPDLQEDLQKEWILHPPKRLFTGVVESPVVPASATITSWLTENKNYVVFASDKDNGGLKAITYYKAVKANNRFTVLNIAPETFRKNQIRVQMQSIGHPIVGDKKYGSKVSPLRRIALHADELMFRHPVTKEQMHFKIGLPKKMQVMVDAINPPNTKTKDE